MSESTATLLVSCADRRGIVAALAQLLYGHDANILDADQHTDARAGVFFQRIRFDTAGLRTDRTTLERGIEEVAERLGMSWRLAYAERVKRVAIFVSRVDHCLYDLLLRHRAGELACEIPLIVSNHPVLEPVAAHFDIPFRVFPISKDTKREQEAREIELLQSNDIDLVVMARYMQVLTEQFTETFRHRVINIHHSFLPAFIGGRPYHQAHARGVKLIGATAHYATKDLDEGPIIEQDVIRSSHGDTIEDLVRKGRDVERAVLSRAVRWHLDDRVLVYGNKTVVFS
jgi:formyltetrahydrofolate deformylase